MSLKSREQAPQLLKDNEYQNQHTLNDKWITQTRAIIRVWSLHEGRIRASHRKWRDGTGSCWFTILSRSYPRDPPPGTFFLRLHVSLSLSLSSVLTSHPRVASPDYHDEDSPLPYHRYHFLLIISNWVVCLFIGFLTMKDLWELQSCLSCSPLSTHCLKHYLAQSRHSVNVWWVNGPCKPNETYIGQSSHSRQGQSLERQVLLREFFSITIYKWLSPL